MTMRLRPLLMASVAVLGLAPIAGARADAIVFDFDNIPQGASTPEDWPSSTSAAFTAEFASPQDLAGFQIDSTTGGFFQNITGHYLASAAAGNVLDIVLAAPVSAFSLDFWLWDLGPDGATSLDYTVLSGGVDGTVVAFGSTSATLTDQFGVEGVLGFSGADFDTIVLTPPDSMTVFAIDNLTLTTAPVPEPAPISLLGVGLAGIGAVRRRRARCPTPDARFPPSPA